MKQRRREHYRTHDPAVPPAEMRAVDDGSAGSGESSIERQSYRGTILNEPLIEAKGGNFRRRLTPSAIVLLLASIRRLQNG